MRCDSQTNLGVGGMEGEEEGGEEGNACNTRLLDTCLLSCLLVMYTMTYGQVGRYHTIPPLNISIIP